MKAIYTILLLVASNAFMTIAWYGHLKAGETSWGAKLSLLAVIMLSWGVALLEYLFMIPANRIGYNENGGPFSLLQLKMIQEVLSISVFMIFTFLFFKNETFRINHFFGFMLLIAAVYFFFKK